MPTLKEKLVGKIKPALNENAMKVLSKRYLKKDNDGNPIEEPNELFFTNNLSLLFSYIIVEIMFCSVFGKIIRLTHINFKFY